MKKVLIVGAVVVVMIIAALAASMFRFMRQEKMREAFRPHVEEYIETDYAPAGETNPYVRGRIVTIDTGRKEVDYWTYPKLPKILQAPDPNSVGTVVLISWDREKVGVYHNTETEDETGDAYRSKADVTLVDWREKRIIAEKTFTGREPIKGLTREGDFTSQWPMFDVIDYITGLPQKPE